jgi:hypothetical protein
MQEVLIDRDQFIGKDFVELLDDCDVAFHDWGPALYSLYIRRSLSCAFTTVKPKLLNNK